MKVTKLKVGKGRTVRAGEQETWEKQYFELEIVIGDPSEIEVARSNALGLIDGWLSQVPSVPGVAQPQIPTRNQGPIWNPDNIKWVQAEGFKGPYERYPGEGQKAEATEDYKAVIADLKAHNGKLSRDDYFYWLFQDGATVGRKPRKQRPSSSNPHARMGRNLHRVKKAGEKLAKE